MNTVLISPKESQVLKYLALGLTSAEIGRVMKISHTTVSTHIKNIKHKTGISRHALLALFALKYGHVTRNMLTCATL